MKRLAALPALAILGFSELSSAQARGVDEFGAYGMHDKSRNESPQYGALELRFGRYVPNVDNSVAGSPFKSTFGDSSRYMVGLEVDWQLLRIPHLGSLGPGLGWGYTSASARARLSKDPTTLSAEDTSLSVMPFYLVGVLRADVFARDYGIPLVPYGKLGVGYALWWSNDGGSTARVDGVLGRGISYGPQYGVGLMFLLDELDQQTARDADNSIGINNSYVFGELYGSDLSGFGAKNRMNVGANTWAIGLAIEF